MYKFLRKLLFKLDPEQAHHLVLNCLNISYQLGLLKFMPKISSQPISVMGLTFPNRIGLAAGFDNNADYLLPLAALGFGFVEVGGVTPKPQSGNAKQRLFRLQQEQGIINRMGFPNKGVDYVASRLGQIKQRSCIIGVNLGRNRDTTNDQAVDDYLYCFRQLHPVADYITINVSSPNTPGLRNLQQREYLLPLLKALKQAQQSAQESTKKYTPLLLKVSPDLSSEEINEIADMVLETNIDGIAATNTSTQRDTIPQSPYAKEMGGLSGAPLCARSTQVIKQFATLLNNKIPIIGLGGIMDEASAQQKLDAGASLLQIYSGLIYQGPGLVKRLAKATS